MKPHSLLAAGTIAIALVCYAQQPGQSKLLKAKDGTFAIYYENVSSASILVDFLVDGEVSFNASGTRLNGFSNDQGLRFSMNALDGVASLAEGQPQRIKHAIASGKVVMDVERETKQGPSLSHLETEAVELKESETEAVFKITRPFLFTNLTKSDTGDRLIELRAPSGVFVLPPLGEPTEAVIPFKSANVPGPVQIKVLSDKIGEDGVIRTLINARADLMSYDAKDRVVRMTGNVTVDYVKKPVDSDKQGVEFDCRQLLIYLNDEGEVVNVQSVTGSLRANDGGGE